MATVIRKGVEVSTIGNLPLVDSSAPAFTLTLPDLSDINLSDFSEKTVILNIFPSIDTPTCATSVREFNHKATELNDAIVLCVSADLPFALGRFCGQEGIDNVISASCFRSTFGNDYGVTFTTGLVRGLLSRSVVIINKEGIVTYTEQVENTSNEPDYDAALAALTRL